jgi:hypothetical protein
LRPVSLALTPEAVGWTKRRNGIIPVYNESFFRKALSRLEDKKRRRILEAILPRLSNLENDVSLLAHTETSIVHRRDVPWLIERLLASDCEQVQKTLIRLIWSLFNSNDIEHVDAVLIASQRNSILAEAFSGFLRSIELDSPQAQKMKSDYLEIHKEIQKRSQELIEYSHNQKQPLLESSPDIGIIALLDELNSGNLAAWWHICREMTLKPDSTHYEEIFELDLTALPGWNTVDTLTRARLIEAAKKYVLNENPEIDSLYSRTTYESDLLGYKALRLLLKEASDFIPTIPREVWKKWVPFILAYSPSNNVKDKELDSELVRMAYQNASDEFIATLILLIDQENREYGSISIIGKVEEFWDERLANSLLNKAKDEKLKLECMECLLNQLYKQTWYGYKCSTKTI